jgi:hypothetical protein
MEINLKSALLVLAASLLVSCGTQSILPGLTDVPGESKITGKTKSNVVGGISQLENSQYKCTRSKLLIKDTKFVRASSEETIEEWFVSSCVEEVHAYMVTYKPEKAEALILHQKRDKSGRVTEEILWVTPGYRGSIK